MSTEDMKIERSDLTICTDAAGRTIISPPLMIDSNGHSLVRSIKVEIGPFGSVPRVTAELMPSEILLRIERPHIWLLIDGMDGGEIASITLRDGRILNFG